MSFRIVVRVAAAALAVFPSFLHAGDNNTADILQISGSHGLYGNHLSIEQSEGQGTYVGGWLDGFPAKQWGSRNNASVSLSGSGGIAGLLQTNLTGLATNEATIIGIGSVDARIAQLGPGNTGRLQVTGDLNRGVLKQVGAGNNGELTVEGLNARGALYQIGSHNRQDMTVTGVGTDATYTQIGSNLAPVGTGPQVFTNGARVQITQIGLSR